SSGPKECQPPAVVAPGCPAPLPSAPQADSGIAPTPQAQPAPAAPTGPGVAPQAFAQAPEGGTGESRSFVPGMFGDLPAQLIRGPLTARLPNGTVQVLPRGIPLATGAFGKGTIFNFDVQQPGLGFVPAGRPLPAAFPAGKLLLLPDPIVGSTALQALVVNRS